MTTALTIDNLHFSYPASRGRPRREAVCGVSVSLPAGGSIALLGPNGCGKSTLMRLITGLQVPDSGAVHVFGQSDHIAQRTLLGVVFQKPGLDPHLTVAENLKAQAAIMGVSRQDASERIVQELQRDDLLQRKDDLVKTLSIGLARRVDLCRALLHRPQLLLLDEPTVGLDPMARATFLQRLESEQENNGVAILMSTHLIDEADRCDLVLLMHNGRIVAQGPPATLRSEVGERMVTLHDALDEPPVLNGVSWHRHSGFWQSPAGSTESAAHVAQVCLENGWSFSVSPPTLADVFAIRTGASLETDDISSEPHHAR